jgi:hypothetical protein
MKLIRLQNRSELGTGTYTLLLRMANTMTSQNIDLWSWDILYTQVPLQNISDVSISTCLMCFPPIFIKLTISLWALVLQHWCRYIHIFTCLLGNATNNLWVLDLTLDLLEFNSYNYSYSLHKFTTHKPDTCLLVRYHFTSYLSCLPVSLLSVSLSPFFLFFLTHSIHVCICL